MSVASEGEHLLPLGCPLRPTLVGSPPCLPTLVLAFSKEGLLKVVRGDTLHPMDFDQGLS